MLKEALVGSLAGGVLALDAEAAFQFMISRPLVCGPIIGFILGDMGVGLAIGVILELLNADNLLVGGKTPSDASLSTVIAVVVALTNKNHFGGEVKTSVLVLSIVYSFYLGFLASKLEHSFKTRINVWLLHRADRYAEDGRIRELARLNWIGLILRYLKNFSLSLVAILIGFYSIKELVEVMPLWSERLWHNLYFLFPFIGFGVVLKTLGIDRTFWLFPFALTVTLLFINLTRMNLVTVLILSSAAALTTLLLLRYPSGITFPPRFYFWRGRRK